jgi:flavin-binding protein dodecin
MQQDQTHTYRKTEIVGSSLNGFEAAVSSGLERARKTIRHLDWFEVTEVRGYLGGDDDGPIQWQVTMKVGFRVED